MGNASPMQHPFRMPVPGFHHSRIIDAYVTDPTKMSNAVNPARNRVKQLRTEPRGPDF